MTDRLPNAARIAREAAHKANRQRRRLRTDGVAFDYLKIGVSRFEWRDPYHFAVTVTWGQFIRGVVAILVAINIVFALLYMAVPGAVQNLPSGNFFLAFFFSLETLGTVGYGEMAPGGLYGHAVAGVEIILGMASTAIMTGVVFVRFSRPQARFLFADHPIIGLHNGRETLMLRLANGRFNTLTFARVRFGVVLAETTDEGENFRNVHDLVLVRTEMPIFPLTWTIMHVIDKSSPLHGLDPETLEAMEAQFYVTLEAHDTALRATVQDVRTYSHVDLAHGMRYVMAITRNESGRPVADLSKLSALEPDPHTAPDRPAQ